MSNSCGLGARDKKGHFGEATDYDPNGIMFMKGHGETTNKIH